MIQVITCRGLFEAVSDRNMLSNLTNRLDRNRFRVEEFSPWAAGFGDYDVALERTAGLLAERVRREPGPIVGAAYSGGAHVWKRAALMLTGSERQKVRRLVLCADPSQPSSLYSNDRAWGSVGPGHGIAEDAPLWMPAGVDYVHDAGDPIPFSPDGSPLHRLAAVLTARRPGLGSLPVMQAKLARVVASSRQDYSVGAYVEAGRLLTAYAALGAHTKFYPALLAQVAEDMNRNLR